MPRFSFLVVVLVASLWAAPVAFAAQVATPAVSESAFGDVTGLPELRITATDIAFEGVPETTAAGRYLVTFVNNATDPEGAGVHFMQLPEGMTLETLMAPPTDAESASRDWFYEVYQAGGAVALPGQTAEVILDLVPGEFVVWGGFPSLPQVPVTMTVTGDATAHGSPTPISPSPRSARTTAASPSNSRVPSPRAPTSSRSSTRPTSPISSSSSAIRRPSRWDRFRSS
jgi:hypothetical protein